MVWDELTDRERELAMLIRDGLENEEIAARMKIAYNTAKVNVLSLTKKLGMNRCKVAVWTERQTSVPAAILAVRMASLVLEEIHRRQSAEPAQ